MLRMGLEFARAKTLQYICIYYVNVLENILTYIKHVNSCNVWYNLLHWESFCVEASKVILEICMVNVYIIS